MDIYLGKSKTGKSKFIYDAIDEDIKNKKNVILFVPSNLIDISKNQYMLYQEKEGIIDVEITTIDSYIKKNIKKVNLHFDEKYISKLEKKIILTKIIAENKDIFEIFKSAKSKQGFIDMLIEYIDIFRNSDEEYNEAYIENLNLKDEFMSEKLKEIVLAYNRYLEKIKGTYFDVVDEINLFVGNILNDSIKFENTKIYFDGYNSFSFVEYKLIDSLLKKNIEITFAITTDITNVEDIELGNSSDIFYMSNLTYKKLLEVSEENSQKVDTKVFTNNYSKASKSLVYLADKVFSEEKVVEKELDDIEITIETNKYTEIENIAKKIKNKIKKGYRYSDFCIYTTNVLEYSNIISKTFEEYDISLYIDGSEKIEIAKLTKYLDLLLEILVKDVNIEVIFELLKLGLNDFNLNDIYILENYVLEFNINKENLYKEFNINNVNKQDTIYDLVSLNETRVKIIEFLESSKKELDLKQNPKKIVEKIYEHLEINKVFSNYLAVLENESDELNYENENIGVIQSAIKDVNLKNLESQVWTKICDVFDSICKIYGEENITLENFYNVFFMGIKDVSIKGILPTKDQVTLVDINSSKIEMKKQVFLIGVNENQFPKKVEQDIIFGDIQLNDLEESGFKLKETSLTKLNMQLFNLYNVLNNTYEKLYIYIPAADVSGKALRTSGFITLIEKVAKIKILGNVVKIDEEKGKINLNDFLSKDKVFESSIQNLKDILRDNLKLNDEDIIKLLAIYDYFKENEKYSEILKYRKNDNDLDQETLGNMFKDRLNTSVSKLEAFERCPFAYFMQYVLNMKIEKKYQISNMETGSLMHNVLEIFSLYLLKNNIPWQEINITENKLDEKYEKIVCDIIEEQLENSFEKHKDSVKYYVLKKKMFKTIIKVVILISRGFNQSEFKPYGYEIEFKEGALFSPIKIELEKLEMYLVGKIDRVDVLEEDNNIYVRIIDYKSSAKVLNVNNIKDGNSLQLITYLTAFIDNFKKNKTEENTFNDVLPAAMLYFNLSDNIVSFKNYTNNEKKIEDEIIKRQRMKGIFLKDLNIIEKMDNKLSESNKKLIDISKGSFKEESKSSKALNEKEFVELCETSKVILKNIGEKLVSGVVKIEPNKKTNPCAYCDFSTVCRKDVCI